MQFNLLMPMRAVKHYDRWIGAMMKLRRAQKVESPASAAKALLTA